MLVCTLLLIVIYSCASFLSWKLVSLLVSFYILSACASPLVNSITCKSLACQCQIVCWFLHYICCALSSLHMWPAVWIPCMMINCFSFDFHCNLNNPMVYTGVKWFSFSCFKKTSTHAYDLAWQKHSPPYFYFVLLLLVVSFFLVGENTTNVSMIQHDTEHSLLSFPLLSCIQILAYKCQIFCWLLHYICFALSLLFLWHAVWIP